MVLPLLVNSLFGLGTFSPLAVNNYLFFLVEFVHCFLACNLPSLSAVSRLPHLCIKRKYTRASPIKYVLVLHSFSSLQLNLENDTHNYVGRQPIWL